MPFSADNLSSVVVTIIGTLSHSHIHSIGIIGYLTTMATSNIPHLIYCIQYILNSIVITLLVRIDRLLPLTPVLADGNGNVLVALDIHCPTHIHLTLLHYDPTHLLWLPGLVRITGVGPEE